MSYPSRESTVERLSALRTIHPAVVEELRQHRRFDVLQHLPVVTTYTDAAEWLHASTDQFVLIPKDAVRPPIEAGRFTHENVDGTSMYRSSTQRLALLERETYYLAYQLSTGASRLLTSRPLLLAAGGLGLLAVVHWLRQR